MKKRIGVIGGGILGLTVANRLQEKYPSARITVFEKEDGPGRHQSSHNSGVLHCGLYYQPGSLKARLAVQGIRLMVDFCKKNDVDHEQCGKVVVATNEREFIHLETLAERGVKNGLKGLKFLTKSELKYREPFVQAYGSLLVPEEGIVDYPSVMDNLAMSIQAKGGTICYKSQVRTIAEQRDGTVLIKTSHDETPADLLVCCAGLYSDRVYRSFTGEHSPVKIIPFRGEYRMLTPEAEELVNHLVYPVPDPMYPFLGVHFTRLVHGGRDVGPNAVLALAREGYSARDFSLTDTIDALSYPGFIRFLKNNTAFTAGEIASSLSKKAFLAKAQKMIPDITIKQLVPGVAGVRAQAVAIDGSLEMDFRIIRHGSQIHVLNAPSPGATASLAIAGHIVDEYIN